MRGYTTHRTFHESDEGDQNDEDLPGKDSAHELIAQTSAAEVWSTVAQWVAGISVLFAAGFAAYQILQARSAARAQATFRYLERLTTEEIAALFSVVPLSSSSIPLN